MRKRELRERGVEWRKREREERLVEVYKRGINKGSERGREEDKGEKLEKGGSGK